MSKSYPRKYNLGDHKNFPWGKLKLMGRFDDYDQAESYSTEIRDSFVKGVYRPSIKKTTYEVWGTRRF